MSYAEFIVIGYDWHSPVITLKSNGAAVDLTDYQITAEFFWRGRNSNAVLSPTNVLLTVVTGDGDFTISDADAGQIRFDLDAAQTKLLDPSPQQLPGPQQVLSCRLTRTDSGRAEWLTDLKIQTRY